MPWLCGGKLLLQLSEWKHLLGHGSLERARVSPGKFRWGVQGARLLVSHLPLANQDSLKSFRPENILPVLGRPEINPSLVLGVSPPTLRRGGQLSPSYWPPSRYTNIDIRSPCSAESVFSPWGY